MEQRGSLSVRSLYSKFVKQVANVKMANKRSNMGREYANAMIKALVEAEIEISRELDGVVPPEGEGKPDHIKDISCVRKGKTVRSGAL